jgi:hypothetical protein
MLAVTSTRMASPEGRLSLLVRRGEEAARAAQSTTAHWRHRRRRERRRGLRPPSAASTKRAQMKMEPTGRRLKRLWRK